MNHWQTTAPQNKKRGSLAGPLMLIVLGLAFLAVNLNLVENFGRLWPVIIIALGIGLLFDRVRK